MRWFLAGILGLILAFAFGLMIRLGVFRDVQIEISNEPELLVIYKEHLGPYHKIVPVIEEVEKWANEHGVDCSRSFGMYLDDPEIVEEIRLRANGGCVVDKIPENLPKEFLSQKILSQKYIKATFHGSPSIGPFKVYTPVKGLAQEQRLTLQNWNLEIYDLKMNQPGVSERDVKMTTTYLFPIKQ